MIAAFAAGVRRSSATRAITRWPCGPQAEAEGIETTASARAVERAMIRVAGRIVIGLSLLVVT